MSFKSGADSLTISRRSFSPLDPLKSFFAAFLSYKKHNICSINKRIYKFLNLKHVNTAKKIPFKIEILKNIKPLVSHAENREHVQI